MRVFDTKTANILFSSISLDIHRQRDFRQLANLLYATEIFPIASFKKQSSRGQTLCYISVNKLSQRLFKGYTPSFSVSCVSVSDILISDDN